jgi:hypothetical protein
VEKEKKAQGQALNEQQKKEAKQTEITSNSIQQPQRSKGVFSSNSASKSKRVKGCSAGAGGGQGGEISQAPPDKITRSGRNVTVPSKFRQYKLITILCLLLLHIIKSLQPLAVASQFTQVGWPSWRSMVVGSSGKRI